MSRNEAIREAVRQVRCGEPQQGRRVTMVPLIAATRRDRPYITLEEALAGGLAEVTEVSQGGSVPDLRVLNKAPSPVLIVDGTILRGAKQNRMVNLTILVPAMSTTIIPVSCVEAGRWAHRTRTFEVSDHLGHARLRREKAVHVSASLRSRSSRNSDQGAVWSEVDRKLAAMRAHSETSSIDEAFVVHSQVISEIVERFHPVEGQVGAIFELDGEPVGLDLFDHETTFAAYLPKLVRAVAIDSFEAREAGAAPGKPDAGESFLKEVSEAETEGHPAVGLGTDVRLGGKRVSGGGLVLEDRLLHLAAFRESGAARLGAASAARFFTHP